MIKAKLGFFADSVIPENWGRSRKSYAIAAGESSKKRLQPQSQSAKDQMERFEARRRRDEQKMRDLMK